MTLGSACRDTFSTLAGMVRKFHWRRGVARLTRPLRNVLAVPVLETFRFTSTALGHRAGLAVGLWIGRGLALADRGQHRLAQRQLLETGVARDPAAARHLATQTFINLARGAVEAMHAIPWTADRIRDRVRVDGLDVLAPLLEGGRGLILVSAHMGNWELLGKAFHAYTGHSLAAAMASQNNGLVTRWLIRWREAQDHLRLLPGRETLAIVRHLRAGGVLLMLADQDSTRSRGIFVDFFGRPAYTPAGPAHLARRLGIPLVPAVIIREEADAERHRLQIAPAIWPDPHAEIEDDIRRMTQDYTRVLEGWIRQHPGQWVWIHDRWRHRPGTRIRVRSAEKRL